MASDIDIGSFSPESVFSGKSVPLGLNQGYLLMGMDNKTVTAVIR